MTARIQTMVCFSSRCISIIVFYTIFQGQNLTGYSPWGSQRVGYNWVTNTFTFNTIFYQSKKPFSRKQSPLLNADLQGPGREREQGKEKDLLSHLAAVSLKQIRASVSVTEAQAVTQTTYRGTCSTVLWEESSVPYTCQQRFYTGFYGNTYEGCPNREGHKFPRGWRS